MEMPGGVLFRTLESLEENEFKDFKRYLQEEVLGFPGISKSRLEKADREDTVDLMLLYYCVNTIKVTREVLKMIQRIDLEEELSKTSSDPEGRSLKKECYQNITFLILHSHASCF